MTLSDEKNKIVLEHLNNNTNHMCPMCGKNRWKQMPDLQFLGMLDPEYKQPIEGKALPVVVISCENCHFLAQFSAMSLGILSE